MIWPNCDARYKIKSTILNIQLFLLMTILTPENEKRLSVLIVVTSAANTIFLYNNLLSPPWLCWRWKMRFGVLSNVHLSNNLESFIVTTAISWSSLARLVNQVNQSWYNLKHLHFMWGKYISMTGGRGNHSSWRNGGLACLTIVSFHRTGSRDPVWSIRSCQHVKISSPPLPPTSVNSQFKQLIRRRSINPIINRQEGAILNCYIVYFGWIIHSMYYNEVFQNNDSVKWTTKFSVSTSET